MSGRLSSEAFSETTSSSTFTLPLILTTVSVANTVETISYALGKSRTSIEASRSSTVITAQISPRRVVLRVMLVIMPAIVTMLSRGPSSASSSPMPMSRSAAKHVLQALQRVIADIQAEHLALERQLGALVPVGQVGNAARQHRIGLSRARRTDHPGRSPRCA